MTSIPGDDTIKVCTLILELSTQLKGIKRREKRAEFSAGDFACRETQVDGARSRVTVKIYIMYKVKNKKKNGYSRRTCNEASETAVRSA